MKYTDYFAFLVDEIHSVIAATVDENGLPVTCAIDIMDWDENGLYFLTAKGKHISSQTFVVGLGQILFPQHDSIHRAFGQKSKPLEKIVLAKPSIGHSENLSRHRHNRS